MASERAMVLGFCGSISSLPCLTAAGNRRAAGGLRAEELHVLWLDQAERDQFLEGLVNLGDERAAGHGHDDVVGQAPAELLGDLIADGLRAFGVVGPQIDVHEAPLVLLADLRAEAVDLVVIAGDAHQARAEDVRAEHLGGLEIGGNEDPGLEAHARRLRGDGVGEIAGGGAAHDLEAERLGLRQSATATTRSLKESVGK